MSPSRRFLIQQAILNAALPYAENQGSLRALHRLGTHEYLGCLVAGDYVRESFCERVRHEYRLLAQRYQEAA